LFFVLAIVVGLLVLGILVFVHELGHFLAAKACKFKVLAFAIGFGRPLWKHKRGDTEYRINAIPFGGYVAMAGNNPDEETSSDGMSETVNGNQSQEKEDIVGAGDNSKPIWQRAVVAIAGPLANFVFALLTLWVMFIYGVDRPAFMDSTRVGVVVNNSAGQEAGFKAGDSILSINGEPVNTWEQVQNLIAQQLGDYNIKVQRGQETLEMGLYIEKSGPRMPKDPTGGLLPARFLPVVGKVMPGGSAENSLKAGDTIVSINETHVFSFDQFAFIMMDYDPQNGPVEITLKRGGEVVGVELTPAFDSTRNRYLLGIEPAPEITKFVKYGPIAAIGPTIAKSWEFTTMIFDVLGKLVNGKVSANQLAGPLNIIPISGFMAFQGFSNILNFMALIGINLAVLNLMPLVITDGGLLMFLGIEAIRKKPLPVKAQLLINKIFIILFLALFLFISYNDVLRLPDFLRLWR
jgi:regulator of sigma E protease